MNIIQQVVFLYFFVVFVDSAERVRRDVGNSCPRNLEWQRGKNCRQNRCVKYRRKGTVAVLRCPRGFGRYGNKQLVCGKDGAWKGEFPVCVKSGCSPIDTSNDLNLVMSLHPKFDDAVITFTCEDESIMFGPAEIHCDGVKWSSLPPRCEAITDLVSCDFEEDMCGWTQDFTVHGNQNWTRDIGPTMTGGTGPKRDHTSPHSDTGHYMYFETSAPIQEGDKGILISPMYPADFSPMCFEFWYHMLGPDDQGHVGSLDVYVKAESDQFEFLQPEFHKEGNQKDIWHKGDIFIDDQIESYQILIVATKKKSYMSDIAIDDVRLHNCTQTTTTTTTSTTAIPTSITQSTSFTTSSEPSTAVATENATISRSIVTTTVMPKTSGTPAITTTTLSDANITGEMNSQTTLAPTGISKDLTAITSTAVKPTSASPIETTALSLNSTTASSPFVTTTYTKRTSTATQTTNRPTITITTLSPSTTSTSTKVPVSSTTTTSTTVTTTTPIATVQSTSPKTTTLATASQAVSTQTRTTTTPPATSTVKLTTQYTPQRTSSMVKTTLQTKLITSTIVSSAPTTQYKSSIGSRSSTSSGISLTSQPSSNEPSKRSSLTSTKTVALSTPRITQSTKAPEQNRSEIVTTTAKQVDKTNSDKDSNATAKAAISTHPEDDTLKPLMIGLGVGIIVGLIIIGIIVWACMRKRKFYTSRYEDELKPITNAASTQSLNNVEYYQDDFDIEHIQ